MTVANGSGLDFKLLQKSVESLANMVLGKGIALDYLSTDQGGACALANTSCCFYVDASSPTEESVDRLLEKAA